MFRGQAVEVVVEILVGFASGHSNVNLRLIYVVCMHTHCKVIRNKIINIYTNISEIYNLVIYLNIVI